MAQDERRERLSAPALVRTTGKIAANIFDSIILPRLGAQRDDVVVAPQHGVDFGVIDLGGGHVMVLTSDPFFVMPQLGWEKAAWLAVHIVASDAATSGLPPAYCTIDLNLPTDLTDTDFRYLWEGVHLACSDIGMAVVTGHTGRYDGCNFPTVGGATVCSIGRSETYITPAMASVGDHVLVTKGAAIETTAMFAACVPETIRERLGESTLKDAESLFFQMSVVRDAAIASSVGVRDAGITTMHDATERGIWNGLHEIALASRVGMVLDADAVIIRPETRSICDLFDIDPFTTSSEGTLIFTCRARAVPEVMRRLDDAGIAACSIGEVTPPETGVRVWTGGHDCPLIVPDEDPFWPALSRAFASVT